MTKWKDRPEMKDEFEQIQYEVGEIRRTSFYFSVLMFLALIWLAFGVFG
jgi:hypothetical protein